MQKTYFNDAVIGNSRMLACITCKGELVRLFWPNIDYPQHIDSMHAGLFFIGEQYSTLWLDGECFRHRQEYIKDTNILKTVCEDVSRGLRVTQTDYVLPYADILVRNFKIENLSCQERDIGFMLYSSGITSNQHLGGILFDFQSDALIHYRHNYYISIASVTETYQFQLGGNAFESARSTWLNGHDSIGMMNDGALSWKLGELMPGGSKEITLFICASHALKGIKNLIQEFKNTDIQESYEITRKYWLDFLENAKQLKTGRSDIDSLYRRSLLVFKLMSDEKTGGLLAAPELDENFTRCGRYAYCWGRDAAFITTALDKCGLHDAVDKFFKWAADTQLDDGSWQQRYHMDGNLAPSWGMQIDEVGTIVWGMHKHYEVTGNIEFLTNMWESVRKAVNFMVSYIDPETQLPGLSYDLWEERFGQHTYSCAAVYSGIMAGVKIAELLRIPEGETAGWRDAAGRIKDAMERVLWKDERGHFIRSIRTKLNPWGSEHSERTTVVKVNPKGYMRDVTLEDPAIDVSLIGVSVPFDVFQPDDERVARTAEIIEKVLYTPSVGGIKRYENDNYIGGNPWVVATLWVALYHIRRGNLDKAQSYLDWVVGAQTPLGLLPEQVDRESGKPAWVIPLTWSHAMFVLTAFELYGEERGEYPLHSPC